MDSVLFLTFVVVLVTKQGMCSYELAAGKPVTSSSKHGTVWTASKAVDGDDNSNIHCDHCFHSGQSPFPTFFRVDLNSAHTVNRFEITFVQSNLKPCGNTEEDTATLSKVRKRSLNYTVMITTHETLNSAPCHQDTTVNPNNFQLVQNETCRGTGRYLSVVQKHINRESGVFGPYLMICELRVYGCPVGFYGKHCSNLCSSRNCLSCDPDNGECWSCLQGWYEPECTVACKNSTFGRNCTENCGYCRNGIICHKENGTCPNSECAAGYKGAFCKTECSKGEFGKNCEQTCGNCREGICDKILGNCTRDECTLGYTGPQCKTACTNNTYGYNCNETCGSCRDGQQCDTRFGNCTNSECGPGYIETLCQTACHPGSYGYKCNDTCGRCKDKRVCNNTLGQCPYSECDRGYRGFNCKTACENGTYGYNCRYKCGYCKNLEPCDAFDGRCPGDTCAPGYEGSLCDALQQQANCQCPPVSAILGGSGGLIVVIILVSVVTNIILRRRYISTSTTKAPETYETCQASSMENQYSDLGEYYEMAEEPSDSKIVANTKKSD